MTKETVNRRIYTSSE